MIKKLPIIRWFISPTLLEIMDDIDARNNATKRMQKYPKKVYNMINKWIYEELDKIEKLRIKRMNSLLYKIGVLLSISYQDTYYSPYFGDVTDPYYKMRKALNTYAFIAELIIKFEIWQKDNTCNNLEKEWKEFIEICKKKKLFKYDKKRFIKYDVLENKDWYNDAS